MLRLLLLSAVVGVAAAGSADGKADKPTLDRVRCTFGKRPLYGKIQIVTAFPDVKIEVVKAFADVKLQLVRAFPNKCGQWQTVDAFPDTKVQFVDAFADVKIRYVEHFPGVE